MVGIRRRSGFLALLYGWIWLSGRLWPDTKQNADAGPSVPLPPQPPPRPPSAVEQYIAHDSGPGGTCSCPVWTCQGGEIDARTPGVTSVLIPCGFCTSGRVALRAWRAYRKAHDLFPGLADIVSSRPAQGPALASSLMSQAERFGRGLADDLDVLTVYLGLLHGGPLQVDGYGDLTSRQPTKPRPN